MVSPPRLTPWLNVWRPPRAESRSMLMVASGKGVTFSSRSHWGQIVAGLVDLPSGVLLLVQPTPVSLFMALAPCAWLTFFPRQYDGQAGVDKMLQVMYDDFKRCMQLCGCNSIKDISKSCLARIGADGLLKRL